jgi:hypothetical protein
MLAGVEILVAARLGSQRVASAAAYVLQFRGYGCVVKGIQVKVQPHELTLVGTPVSYCAGQCDNSQRPLLTE